MSRSLVTPLSISRPECAVISTRPMTSYAVTPGTSVSTGIATEHETAEILRLMRANFSWSREAGDWHRWAYEQSPFRSNRCWFAETERQETVGFTALMPRRMKVADTVCDAGQAANLNVEVEHRGTAAAIKLQRAVVSHVDESELALVFGITRNAVAVQRRAGYHDLGTFSRWIKLFRTEHKLRDRISSAWPRRAVARVLDAALRLRARETWYRMPRGWLIQHDLPFDERFDQLWEAAAQNYGVATERSSVYLNWRFGRDPQLKYRTLTVQNERGELRGYAIYLERDPEETLPFGAIVDLLAVDQPAADALLASLSSHLRRSGAVGMQMLYFGSPLIEGALQCNGFFRRSHNFHLLAHFHPSHKPRESELLAPAHWHMTEAEAKF